jgi:hypothetical protein
MADTALVRIAEDLRRMADSLDALANPGGDSRAETLDRSATEIVVCATRHIITATSHCPELLGPLRPDRFGVHGAPLICTSLVSNDDMLRFWIMYAIPWINSRPGAAQTGDMNILPSPHLEPGKPTLAQKRKQKRLAAAYKREYDKARPPDWKGTPPTPWTGAPVDFPAIRRQIDHDDPTPLDVPPVAVYPEGYNDGWKFDDGRRRARFWADAMRAFAGVIEAATPSTATSSEVPLLERVLTALTPNQGRIMDYLWNKKTASFEALGTIQQAWQNSPPSDETITAELKKMNKRLDANSLSVVALTISTAKKRASLERPAD